MPYRRSCPFSAPLALLLSTDHRREMADKKNEGYPNPTPRKHTKYPGYGWWYLREMTSARNRLLKVRNNLSGKAKQHRYPGGRENPDEQFRNSRRPKAVFCVKSSNTQRFSTSAKPTIQGSSLSPTLSITSAIFNNLSVYLAFVQCFFPRGVNSSSAVEDHRRYRINSLHYKT